MKKLSLKDSLIIQRNKALADPNAMANVISGKPRPLSSDAVSTFYYLFGTGVEHIRIMCKEDLPPEHLLDYLTSSGWETLYKSQDYRLESDTYETGDVLLAHPDGYIINFSVWYNRKNKSSIRTLEGIINEFRIYDEEPRTQNSNKVPYVNEIEIYYKHTHGPIEKNPIYIKLCEQLKKISIPAPQETKIGIVSVSDGEYYVKEFSLEHKKVDFKFPDEHYGEGFTEFHNQLLQRLHTDNKGLVLFHGQPGTGKTMYIRMLLAELSKLNKSVLYAPPGLSASLTDPNMIEFISEWIYEENQDCILLIEDAEPLLENRSSGDGRSIGISNLLNMTDGLLNDILGLTVIATFNMPITNIDPALLRQQRLIARKEFKKLSGAQAEKLSAAIGIELPDIEYPATLAEFYASRQDNQTLTHDIEVINNKIGFKI